ncbi:zinc finger domain-containing protein [Glutamicibacter sp. NPDC087344]|uniref:zinc finger domain-containing protein n=1 Tax=Glutamicibacter sp. NPDC087344 TaxID=3363994 RepID=UPI0038299668
MLSLSLFQCIYRGKWGYFSRYLHSHSRTWEPCDRCGTKSRRIRFGDRSLHLHLSCQPRR